MYENYNLVDKQFFSSSSFSFNHAWLSPNLMISFSLVLACTACPLFWVKWMRSTPYLDKLNMTMLNFVCWLVLTFCCWEPASGSLSRSRRWLSGRLHLKLWCSAHHCWGCETSNQESIVGVAWQTCSECLWFAPYCPCTVWPPACWKFEDESDAQLWLCDRIYYFLEPCKRNSMSLRFHVCFIWLSNFATKTCLFKYFYQI